MPQEVALEAALAEDLEGSFERMVGEYQDRLYSFAHRLAGNPEDAEEIAQDAFVRAYRAMKTYEAERIRAGVRAAYHWQHIVCGVQGRFGEVLSRFITPVQHERIGHALAPS